MGTERLCPFCRFPLKADTEAHACHECGAEHHPECWDDNTGCAIMGCAAAPDATAPPPPRARPAAGATPAPPPPSPPSASASSRGLAAAIIVLAVAVAGVALAVVVTRPSDPVASAPAAVAAEQTPEATPPQPTETATAEPTEEPTPERTPAPSPEPTEEPTPEADPREEIEAVLVKYYDHIVQDEFDAAWKLLSPSYKRWKSSNGGYPKWAVQEEFHRDRLDPSGLHVEIRRIDGDIATIDVSGMHYRADWDPDCEFEGVTWFRRSGGRWRYDQGYLQSAARSAEWRPKRRQTLGFTCEVDGY